MSLFVRHKQVLLSFRLASAISMFSDHGCPFAIISSICAIAYLLVLLICLIDDQLVIWSLTLILRKKCSQRMGFRPRFRFLRADGTETFIEKEEVSMENKN